MDMNTILILVIGLGFGAGIGVIIMLKRGNPSAQARINPDWLSSKAS